MKVLVCISNVPDTTSKIKFVEEGKQFEKAGVQFIINPYDEFGLTRAIWLQEKNGAEVTVLGVGTAEIEPTLRKALAIGADKAVRIDLEPKNGMQVAKEITNYAKDNAFDLIIMGRESIDYNSAIVPGATATLLGMNFVDACTGLEIEGDSVKLVAEADGGKASYTTKMPLVVAGQKGLVEDSDLKIPNMRGIMQARTKPLEVLASCAAETVVETVSHELPPEKGACKMTDSVDELVNLLSNEAKVL